MCFLANIGFYLNTSAKIYGCHFHADVGTFNNNHKRHLGKNIYEIRPVLKVSGCFIWIFNWFSFAQFILLLRKMLFRKDEKWKKNKKNFSLRYTYTYIWKKKIWFLRISQFVTIHIMFRFYVCHLDIICSMCCFECYCWVKHIGARSDFWRDLCQPNQVLCQKKCVTASFKHLYILSTSNILCDTTASEIKTNKKETTCPKAPKLYCCFHHHLKNSQLNPDSQQNTNIVR